MVHSRSSNPGLIGRRVVTGTSPQATLLFISDVSCVCIQYHLSLWNTDVCTTRNTAAHALVRIQSASHAHAAGAALPCPAGAEGSSSAMPQIYLTILFMARP